MDFEREKQNHYFHYPDQKKFFLRTRVSLNPGAI